MKSKRWLKWMSKRIAVCLMKQLRSAGEIIERSAEHGIQLYRRIYARIAVHKAEMGYYAVLTLVLIALGAAANDYRSKRTMERLIETLPTQDVGISVQTKPDQTLPPKKDALEYILPVQGSIVRSFSDSELIWSTTLQLWQTHPAVDIAASAGEAVYAAAEGVVSEEYTDSLYGNVIVIEHDDGSRLRYSSLNTLQLVETGQRVHQGDVISAVGVCDAEAEIGAHVHLEYFEKDQPADFACLLEADEMNSLQN